MENEIILENGKTLEDFDLICVLSGALTGCVYWCQEIDYGNVDYQAAKDKLINTNSDATICFEDVLLQMLKDNNFVYFCFENNKRELLTLPKLLDSILRHASNGNEDMDNWDDEDYDTVIQYALFNELIYG